MARRRLRTALVLSVALLAAGPALAGCGSDEADSAPLMDASGTGPLEFTAPLVGGGTFDGAAYAERPVAFWFWAPT